MPKKCAIGETKCYEILSLYLRKTELIRRERRYGGEGEERGLRKGAERDREKRDKIEEEDKEHTCLWLLFSFLKALSSRLDSSVKRCSIEL